MRTTRIITALTAAISLISCNKDYVDISRGKQLDKASLDALSDIVLRIDGTVENSIEITMTKGAGSCSKDLYVITGEPLANTQTMLLQADTSLVGPYSEATGTKYSPLPESYFRITDGGTLDMAEGSTRSDSRQITLTTSNKAGNILNEGRYLLPVTLVSPWQKTGNSTVYIDVTVRKTQESLAPLHSGKEMFMIFYINTSQFDPRLATDFYMEKSTGSNRLWYEGVGNIVNLRKSSIGYDKSTGKAKLELSADMKYLLSNYDTYIRPVQETGRKVCLCIEGGGQGLGFCNMSDSQIEDFIYQVKTIVERHKLNGVNLWDRNSSYGKEPDLPSAGTTSYPKLIKGLRQALGAYKLLTVTDFEQPTEYFWDVEACGGIEVGKLIDYAWSGYNDSSEPIQVIDPYHQGGPGVSTLHPRRPIAGLNPKRYGCTNAYWHQGFPIEPYLEVLEWEKAGLRQNRIFVFEDVRSLLQDKYEGGAWNPDNFIQLVLSPDYSIRYMIDVRQLSDRVHSGYNKWIKNW